MIDCAKARELSGSYIDGELNEAACLSYEEHISCCESCHEEYDMLKKVSVDLSAIATPLPEGFARRMHTALVNEQFKMQKEKEKKSKGFVFPLYRVGSLVAAALVITVIGKYGVYDTYKKVMEDASHMTTMLHEKETPKPADTPAAEEPAPPQEEINYNVTVDNSGEITPSYENTTDNMEEVIPEEPIAPVNDTVEEFPVEATADVPETEESAPAAEDTAAMFSLEKADDTAKFDTGESSGGDHTQSAPSVARAMMPDAAEAVQEEEGITNDTDIAEAAGYTTADTPAASGGGSSSAAATELIPAVVTIHNSGDGSMIMFKKFLLTFLDSSEISENNGEITVTVTDDEYDSVIQRLRSNEYVKSVTEGTPSGGKAVITIR